MSKSIALYFGFGYTYKEASDPKYIEFTSGSLANREMHKSKVKFIEPGKTLIKEDDISIPDHYLIDGIPYFFVLAYKSPGNIITGFVSEDNKTNCFGKSFTESERGTILSVYQSYFRERNLL